MEYTRMLGFELRVIHNLTKEIVRKSHPDTDKPPLTQLQAGIMGYLFHNQESSICQKHIEEEFNISGATVSNTLQVMEKNGLIIRSSMDEDARLKRITMTPTALQDHMLVEEHMQMMERKMREGMSDAEQEELFRLLAVVRDNMEKMSKELS
ncbi:MAG: winged helix-turn-helix transcriptional regulator [Lachnospiraceae bacterium]|nr:winged helix-turn-helix transcriptional regulator [Lachnospiraceae bacterium]